MNIQCPSCRFERDVPDSALRPGKIYKVTCPRCSSVFQFSMPEEDFVIEAADEAGPAPAVDTSPSVEAAPVQTPPAQEKTAEPSSSSLSSEQEGDDPLPPGAAIPEFARDEQKKSSEEAPAEAGDEEQTPAGDEKDSDAETGQDEGMAEEYQPHPDGRPAGAPWESPEYYGFWGSFSRTLIGVLFHAPEFFRHVKCQFSVIRPILFYVLLSLFQVLCARLWSIKALQEISATTADPQTLAMAEQLMQSMNMPLMLLITPFFSIFQVVILSGIYHLMIRMVQPDRADFASTLRVVCYSAAPLVLCIVPMFGSAVATMWSVVTVFVGVRYALKLSWLRTVLALLPLYILELAFISQIPSLMGM